MGRESPCRSRAEGQRHPGHHRRCWDASGDVPRMVPASAVSPCSSEQRPRARPPKGGFRPGWIQRPRPCGWDASLGLGAPTLPAEKDPANTVQEGLLAASPEAPAPFCDRKLIRFGPFESAVETRKIGSWTTRKGLRGTPSAGSQGASEPRGNPAGRTRARPALNKDFRCVWLGSRLVSTCDPRGSRRGRCWATRPPPGPGLTAKPSQLPTRKRKQRGPGLEGDTVYVTRQLRGRMGHGLGEVAVPQRARHRPPRVPGVGRTPRYLRDAPGSCRNAETAPSPAPDGLRHRTGL